jgi:glucose-6-phosphate 1-dehydrogenase
MEIPQNQILVIFGASGDLTKRKLIPALHNLHQQKRLPKCFSVLGVGRKTYDDKSFQEKISNDTNIQDNEFIQKLHYISIDTKKESSYKTLSNKLALINKQTQANENYIYYFAVPPSVYTIIASNLNAYKLTKSKKTGWKRVIVEKPFGYDLDSAITLNKKLLSNFKENQIFRIDHYLGKETVQNIMVTRFSNSIFEPLWNRNHIDHVQITSAESIGIERRGEYYDTSGALRDMVQNHLLQLVGMIAMEPPALSDSNAIRNETLKVFQSIKPLIGKEIDQNVIRAQYTENKINEQLIPSYIKEEGVPHNSNTETYVALKLNIDNWRWKDVPFFIRTGKRLPQRVTEIVIQFRPTPHHIFCIGDETTNKPNRLIIRIQPDEGLLLSFGMKIPGAGFNVHDVGMDFHYSDLTKNALPSAYERLILDCMNGDSTLYARGDAVEKTWEFISPILNKWKKGNNTPLFTYKSGTWGPKKASDLIYSQTGSDWRNPCKNIDESNYCKL